MTTTRQKSEGNLYVRTWHKEKELYKWTWDKTKELCKPEREDYGETPKAPKHYKVISRAYTVRGGAGYLVWVALSILGYVGPGSKITTWGQTFYVAAPYWMPVPCLIAVSAVLYATTKPTAKRATLRSLSIPMSRVLLLIPSVGILMVILWLSSQPGANTIWGLDNWAPHPSLLINLLGGLSTIIAIVILPLWLAICVWVPFAPTSVALRLYWNNFRAIDGHPYLGPLTAITSVWATVIYQATVTGPGRSFRADAHLWLRLTTSWGGPVILSAIALIEIIWLWQYVGHLNEGSIPPPVKKAEATSGASA